MASLMAHQQLQAHSACQWLGFSQLPFRVYQDSCHLSQSTANDEQQTHERIWQETEARHRLHEASLPCKIHRYMRDTVRTTRIQLLTNLFLEGQLGFILLLSIELAALSSAGLMLWRYSATKLWCPRKIRLEIKVIFLFFRTYHEWYHFLDVPVQGRAQKPCTKTQQRELTTHSPSCYKLHLMYIPISSHYLSQFIHVAKLAQDRSLLHLEIFQISQKQLGNVVWSPAAFVPNPSHSSSQAVFNYLIWSSEHHLFSFSALLLLDDISKGYMYSSQYIAPAICI